MTDNPPIRIYVNQIENRIIFTLKIGYYLELLKLETITLLGSTKSKINKDENGENVPRLEITEAVLVHCDIANNDYQQNSRILYKFFPNKSFGQLLDISHKILFFKKCLIQNFRILEYGSLIKIQNR